MSFAKLFESILDSTIWQEADHVRLVWITMLAMKNWDGEVEASIPGLAKRAGVELEKTKAALAVLMAPDEYSRTKDHEGRRIAEIDGGWLILNHKKYRDRGAAEERKARDAERAARNRAKDNGTDEDPSRPSAPVRSSPDPSGPVRTHPDSSEKIRKVRHTDTDLPEQGERGPDPDRASSSPSGASGSGTGPPRDRVQAPPAAPAPQGSPRDAMLARLARELGAEHVRRYNAVIAEEGLKVPTMSVVGGPAERAMLALLRAQETLEGFGEQARHVLAVREQEARKARSVKFFGQTLWSPDSFGIALSMQVGEDRRPPQRESHFAIADKVFDELAKHEQEPKP